MSNFGEQTGGKVRAAWKNGTRKDLHYFSKTERDYVFHYSFHFMFYTIQFHLILYNMCASNGHMLLRPIQVLAT